MCKETEDEMEKLPKAEYSPEFREQAVQTYQESGLSVAEVAKRLSIPKSSLNYWVKAAKKGKLALVGKNQKPVTEMEMELSRLKRELAEARMERDFLKKCTAYFAKGSR
jgi:transposase